MPNGGGAWTQARFNSLEAGGSKGSGGQAYDLSCVMVMVAYMRTTWESYSDSGHTTVENSFSGSTNHVYMKGEGFPSGTIKVGYYDGAGVWKQTDTFTDWGGGTLDWSECLFTTWAGPPPTAEEGTWHAVVLLQAVDIPNTYADAIADADYVTDDDFYVASSAIPEFPTVTTAVVVIGLCAVIYYWMRRKRLAHVKT